VSHVWAALLAIIAGWCLAVAASWPFMQAGSGQLPIITVPIGIALCLIVALAPVAPVASRLRLMQALAALGLALMVLLAQ
jgi:hypothetical protein